MKTNLFKFSVLFLMASTFIGNTSTTYAQQKFASWTETKNFVLENGDSICIKLTTNTPSTNTITYSNTTHTISGNKELLYKNANGELLWSFTLSASFSYTGNSSTCTSVNTSSSFVSSSWKFGDSSKSKIGNTASGTITAYQYTLGIRIKTITETLNLTCSKDGILS